MLGAPILAILIASVWLVSGEATSIDSEPAPIDCETQCHDLRMRGDVSFQNGLLDEAEESWRCVIQLDPHFAPAWLKLGMLALERDRPEEAVPLLRRSITLAPSTHESYYNLSLAYRRLGREPEAERYQTLAVRFRNGSPPKTTMGILPRSEP